MILGPTGCVWPAGKNRGDNVVHWMPTSKHTSQDGSEYQTYVAGEHVRLGPETTPWFHSQGEKPGMCNQNWKSCKQIVSPLYLATNQTQGAGYLADSHAHFRQKKKKNEFHMHSDFENTNAGKWSSCAGDGTPYVCSLFPNSTCTKPPNETPWHMYVLNFRSANTVYTHSQHTRVWHTMHHTWQGRRKGAEH